VLRSIPSSEQQGGRLRSPATSISEIPLTDADIIHLVIRMRTAQKEYFRTRDRTFLDVARKLEREVDAALERRKEGPKAFLL
jgi:hypothetical protein